MPMHQVHTCSGCNTIRFRCNQSPEWNSSAATSKKPNSLYHTSLWCQHWRNL